MLPLSPPLQSQADSFLLRCQEHSQKLPDVDEDTLSVVAASDFICENLLAFPQWWHEIVQHPPQAQEWQHYRRWLGEALAEVSDEAGLMKALRLFRKRILTRIAWSQALMTSECEETLHQLSELAETLIVSAREWLYDACCREFGTPVNA